MVIVPDGKVEPLKKMAKDSVFSYLELVDGYRVVKDLDELQYAIDISAEENISLIGACKTLNRINKSHE